MPLSKAEILAADDLRRELVPVPEWGGDVLVATMNGTARDEWEASLLGADGKPTVANAHAKLAAACMVDESGARLFDSTDVEALGRKSSAALKRVADVASRLNRIGEKDLEDLKGN